MPHGEIGSIARRFAVLVGAWIGIVAAPALASGVGFVNDNGVRVLLNGATVAFSVSAIQNNSNFTSNTLRVELWAAANPPVPSTVIGTVPKDYKLAQFTLGALGAGQQLTNVKSPTMSLGTPPDGVWYYILFLTEFTGNTPANGVGGLENDGFTVADWVIEFSSVAIGPQPPPPAATALAIEYYNADWGFYFITAFPGEIEALDAGAFDGVWQRTGASFAVWPQPTAGSYATCRFFSGATFAPKSTHFYTPFGSECGPLQSNPAWSYEGVAFYIALPDANGLCPAGTIPLYRAYNNGIGGAPNHRYTTNLGTLQQMLDAGWAFEGNGNTRVFACVPPPS